MLEDINQLIEQLDKITILPKSIDKALSYVKLYRSAYNLCGDKALPQLQEYYQELWDALYMEFKSYPFYSDTPLCKLLREIFDPELLYVEPWGYESTYSSI